jgi:hypothetical protein
MSEERKYVILLVTTLLSRKHRKVCADFTGVWQDTLTVTSSTLTAGTPVDLLFTMSFKFSTVCTGSNTSPSATVEFIAGSQNAIASSTACNATFAGTSPLDFKTVVGANTAVEGFMHSVSGAGSSVQVDPPANFSIDSGTLGATYTTASGFTYFTPSTSVPEPSSLILFGSGMLTLMDFSLKKKALA